MFDEGGQALGLLGTEPLRREVVAHALGLAHGVEGGAGALGDEVGDLVGADLEIAPVVRHHPDARAEHEVLDDAVGRQQRAEVVQGWRRRLVTRTEIDTMAAMAPSR